MKAVGFFFFFLFSVFIALLAVFQSDWLLFPNVSLPSGLPERWLPHFGVDGRPVGWL